MDKTLVLARHNESIEWLSAIDAPVVIYNKGNEIASAHPVVNLKNIGRESHTYLWHIIENYFRLTEWTIFAQADPFPHTVNFVEVVNCKDPNEMWMENIRVYRENVLLRDGFFGIGRYWESSSEFLKGFWCNIYEMIKTIWKKFKCPQPMRESWPNSYGACFAVERRAVHRRPLGFYRDLLALHDQMWTLPWAMEYLWWIFFSLDYTFYKPWCCFL